MSPDLPGEAENRSADRAGVPGDVVPLPGAWGILLQGFQHALEGTNDWASCETPFLLKKGQRPDLIKLNLVVEGRGKVLIKDVQLLKTPLR
jgi:hypothetical protein